MRIDPAYIDSDTYLQNTAYLLIFQCIYDYITNIRMHIDLIV